MDLAEKLAEGGVYAVVGGALPALPGRQVVRVRCGRERLGPWIDARDRLAALVEAGDGRLVDAVAERLRSGLRRRFLGDLADADPVPGLLTRLSLLAERLPPTVLVFEGAEAVDEASLRLLTRAAARPGLVPFPVILRYEAAALGEGERLFQELERRGAVVHLAAPAARPEAPAPPAPLEPPASGGPLHPPEVLLVLRAAAVEGPRFTVEAVARRVGVAPEAVLLLLQRAADAGEPLADDGAGTLTLATDRAEALRQGLLPSLAALWARPHDPPVAPPEPPAARHAPVPPPDPFEPVGDRTGADLPRPAAATLDPDAGGEEGRPWVFNEESPPLDLEALVPPASPTPVAFGFGRDEAAEPVHPAQPPASALDQAVLPTPGPRPPLPRATPAAEERAHLALAHARAHEVAGEIEQAVTEVRAALASLAPARSAEARRLGAALHAELGRLLWRAAGPGAEFTLDGALDALARAEDALDPDDPAALRALVWSVQAGVLQDRGDAASLEAALQKLDAAMRALQAAGDARAAARLLNDQAGVWVRLGDPVRAAHLLRESRAVFARSSDPDARMELAETDLCLARLSLHAPVRPGMEPELVARALDHAREAAATWEQLGMTWEVARARETEGRLLSLAGNHEAASRVLTEAAGVQAELGDVLGVARSSAALAELLAATGRPRDALEMLAQSARLNAGKGSAIGVAWNRRSFDLLWAGLDPRARRLLLPVARQVAELLETAERRLGRVRLPDDEA